MSSEKFTEAETKMQSSNEASREDSSSPKRLASQRAKETKEVDDEALSRLMGSLDLPYELCYQALLSSKNQYDEAVSLLFSEEGQQLQQKHYAQTLLKDDEVNKQRKADGQSPSRHDPSPQVHDLEFLFNATPSTSEVMPGTHTQSIKPHVSACVE